LGWGCGRIAQPPTLSNPYSPLATTWRACGAACGAFTRSVVESGAPGYPPCLTQVTITRDVARFSMRVSTVVVPSRLWFDSEAREQFKEGVEGHLDRCAMVYLYPMHVEVVYIHAPSPPQVPVPEATPPRPVQDILSLVFVGARINHPFITPPICIAHTTAILLHDVCAMQELFPTLPLYAIHHTLLVMTISCKCQTTPPPKRPPGRPRILCVESIFTYSCGATTSICTSYSAWLTLYMTWILTYSSLTYS